VVATEERLALWRTGQLRATAPLAERIKALDPDELRRFEEALPLFTRIMETPAL
jgi:hypothetical protein